MVPESTACITSSALRIPGQLSAVPHNVWPHVANLRDITAIASVPAHRGLRQDQLGTDAPSDRPPMLTPPAQLTLVDTLDPLKRPSTPQAAPSLHPPLATAR